MNNNKEADIKKILPRQVPSRDDYYTGLALWVASRSKDPYTQVGAVIVSTKNEPISTGYNGAPRSIPDDEIDWSRPDSNEQNSKITKYDWVIHAESNAIKHAHGDLNGAIVYVTALPCNRCMLELVAVGVKRVVYLTQKKNIDQKSSIANQAGKEKTFEIARMGQVNIEEYKGNLNWMRDRLDWLLSIGYLI